MRFFSDNAASAHPAVLDALVRANAADTAYDGDALSQSLNTAFGELFEAEVSAFWINSGTAANSLALAALCPPYGAIICTMMHIFRMMSAARLNFSRTVRSCCR